MTWVVELTGYDPVTEGDASRRFAMGAGIAPTDVPFIPPGLVSWMAPSQKVDVSRDGGVQLSADAGRLAVQNTQEDYRLAGSLDYLVKWSWKTVKLYWVTTTWSGRTLVDQGVLQQPVSDLTSAQLQFPIRDPRFSLKAPLRNTKFAGDNSGGSGVEGGEDLKGVMKPILYGIVSNIPGVLVNKSKLIYQVADAAVTVLCARDGGISLTAGTLRANVSSLQSNTPPSGSYDYCSGSGGTYIRLGSSPIFQVTFDAADGASEAYRTHAALWSRIRTERCGTDSGDIESAGVAATNTDAPKEVGFWWNSETTQLDAINEVLTSLSGYEVLTFDGDWRIGKLKAPSGTTAFDLIQMSATADLKTKTRPVLGLGLSRPNYAPDGIPPYRVNVRWGRNYTVMNPSDFAGGAPARLKDKFSKEWRVETATNTDIWDPDTETGPWVDAPELTIATAYQPGVDGLSCPHALSEAEALLDLYGGLKGQYQTDFYGRTPTDRLLVGDVVSLTHPQMDLDAGPLFRVLQVNTNVDSDARARLSLVIGFQT